uniref:DNA-directed RNA polymerase III subunit RPC6 n=1 Tax=Plectus sambesii TaxID=2011161 RepID=A0A914ULI8_9BILA
MAATVKKEPVAAGGASSSDGADLETQVIELLSTNPNGITNQELMAKTVHMDAAQRGMVVNRLLSTGRIEMKKTGAGNADFLLKLRNMNNAEKIKGASAEETVVYGLIEEAENRGIWIRDVRNRSGLSQTQLNKVLKTLEHRKLVKSIKTLGATKKRVYMLYELEPDASLTGGAFYSEQEFDSQFVDLLNQQCLKFLKARSQLALEKHGSNLSAVRRMSFVPSTEVWQHINDLKISRIELTIKDVERVLDSVVFDGEAEREPGEKHPMYRSRAAAAPPAGLTRVPCLYCPVFSDCKPGHVVSPASCAYFQDWLT